MYCKNCLKQHLEWFETSAAEAIAVVDQVDRIVPVRVDVRRHFHLPGLLYFALCTHLTRAVRLPRKQNLGLMSTPMTLLLIAVIEYSVQFLSGIWQLEDVSIHLVGMWRRTGELGPDSDAQIQPCLSPARSTRPESSFTQN